jgi:hypothetical protein
MELNKKIFWKVFKKKTKNRSFNAYFNVLYDKMCQLIPIARMIKRRRSGRKVSMDHVQ